MNDFDKNFHINFSPLYIAATVMFFLLWAVEAKASEIEEVIVVAQQEMEVEADPLKNDSLIEVVMPAFTYPQGGPGGFVGYMERGAQTNHTAVFVNGIPANDPGAGWYDFGHDIAHGQSAKVITGGNSVMYGSGSMAGTVLIQDTIEHGVTYKTGGDHYIRVAPVDQFELSLFDGSIGSVRNDNNEKDNYVNKTARFNIDVGDFKIVGKYTSYEYDYDNCFNYDWQQSNDCLQDGERYNIAVRNDFMTIGRNYNNADYYTGDLTNDGTFYHKDQTYANESYRDFMRFGNEMNLSKNLNVAFGLDAEKIYYNTISWQMVEGSTEVETELTEPAIYYDEEADPNKVRPLWNGEFIGTGEFVTSIIGDGVFTLTELDEKYTDENVGLYFSANANFVLNYNFGVRVGNDNQNALRLGISQGEWFLNVGNSFRKPNLYELNGDGYVEGNAELDPEQGVGIELGYGAVSIFRYDFEESIEYIPGYYTDINSNSIELDVDATLDGPGIGCVLISTWNANDEATFGLPGCIYSNVTKTTQVWNAPTYMNTGSYITQGIRYANNFGPVFVSLKYTDTEQARVPKYVGLVKWEQTFNDVNINLQYAVNLDRAPGPYDFLEEGQEFLEDLHKLDLIVSKELGNGVTLAFRGQNLTDEVVEIVPYYNNQGRQLSIALNYKW